MNDSLHLVDVAPNRDYIAIKRAGKCGNTPGPEMGQFPEYFRSYSVYAPDGMTVPSGASLFTR